MRTFNAVLYAFFLVLVAATVVGIALAVFGVFQIVTALLTYFEAALWGVEVNDKVMLRSKFLSQVLHGLELILVAPLTPAAWVAAFTAFVPWLAPFISDLETPSAEPQTDPKVSPGQATSGSTRASRSATDRAPARVQLTYAAFEERLHRAEWTFAACVSGVIAVDMASRLLTNSDWNYMLLYAEAAALIASSIFLWALSRH